MKISAFFGIDCRRGLCSTVRWWGAVVLWLTVGMQYLPAQTGWLTNAAQIRNLTADKASRHLPVRLQGVMISEASSYMSDNLNTAIILQDPTAGIYIIGTTNLFGHATVGDLLTVEGVTDPGGFAPIVVAHSAHRAGTEQLPKPQPVTFEELLAGGLDAQLVEVSGVVRSWEPTSPGMLGYWHMNVAMDGGHLSVVCNCPRPTSLEQDTEVHFFGVCFYEYNQERQVLRPMLLVSQANTIQVNRPASTQPFASNVRPIASLLQFSPINVPGHRVHVRGTVTSQEPGMLMWIRDGSGGLRVETQQVGNLQVGDEVDVLGYPRYGSYTPVLEDAIFRKMGTNQPPVPTPLTNPDEAFNHQEDLVSLKALLTDVQPTTDGWAFTLSANGVIFKAALRKPSLQRASAIWRPNSQVQVTGICSAIPDDSRPVLSGVWHPQSFQILLRSPADLVVLIPPSWWTSRHIIALFGGLAVLSLLASGSVIWLARHRLREQAVRRAQVESEFTAILAERNRMAREIHDTLAQGLTATLMQIRLAKKHLQLAPDNLPQYLDTAQQLVQGSLQEARSSIWNMRSHILEKSDLPGALDKLLKQLTEGTGMDARLEVTGKPRRLAPVIENNLLRVCQEAMTNAIRHAQARHLLVNVVYGDYHFKLIVRDDGQGFNPTVLRTDESSFGLTGMKERAAQLQGQLVIQSSPCQGTEIFLTVPLARNEAGLASAAALPAPDVESTIKS